MAQLERELSEFGVAVDTASLLDALAHHNNELARGHASEVLGLRGEGAAAEALLEAAKEDDSWLVRESSAGALHRLGRSEGLDVLRGEMKAARLITRRLGLAAQLARLGDSSGYALVVEALDNPDVWRSAMFSLVPFLRFEQLEAQQALIGQTYADDPAVRRQALTSLGLDLSDQYLQLSELESVLEASTKDSDEKVRETAGKLLRRWRMIERFGGSGKPH